MGITKFDDWPHWLQVVVIVPHGLLGMFATLVWWPKSDRGWRRLGFVAAYLLIFYCVMHFVFQAK
jgi:hypothetical protein